MHYYQHHIGDFIKATARLSDSQAMAYLRLLWNYYDKDGIIQCDIEQIAFEIGADQKTVDLIIKTYFKVEDGFIKQSRCDKEIEGYLKKSSGGKEGANKRWKNKDADGLPNGIPNSIPNSIPNADAMPTQCDPNANQEPRTNNQEPIHTTQGDDIPTTGVSMTPGVVCSILRSKGISSVNPSNPKLQTLLAANVPLSEFEYAAGVAIERGKGFAYAIGIVEGRLAEANNPSPSKGRAHKFDAVAYVNQGRKADHDVIDAE